MVAFVRVLSASALQLFAAAHWPWRYRRCRRPGPLPRFARLQDVDRPGAPSLPV